MDPLSISPLVQANDSEEDSPEACFHCNLPVPPKEDIVAEIDGEPQHFCCVGCKAVCEAIYAAGLDGFYLRTPEDGCLAPPPEIPKELALYDLDEVQESLSTTWGRRERYIC
ncbi:MAG: heavy metal translocating P-type ATPase metal-binding domain-containing protein [Candidatus Thiodiazotropha sp.]